MKFTVKAGKAFTEQLEINLDVPEPRHQVGFGGTVGVLLLLAVGMALGVAFVCAKTGNYGPLSDFIRFLSDAFTFLKDHGSS